MNPSPAPVLATLACLSTLMVCSFGGQAAVVPAETSEPPVIPIGYDAFLHWEQWPVLRLGVRAYMRSTFDRTGGNHNADAAHFIRILDDQHSVALDESGPGILWFVRHNHWHGSPWSYTHAPAPTHPGPRADPRAD
jgi:hypothetical protein